VNYARFCKTDNKFVVNEKLSNVAIQGGFGPKTRNGQSHISGDLTCELIMLFGIMLSLYRVT
jgi:hypothetical protein